MYPQLTAVHPFFRRHVPRKESNRSRPANLNHRRFLHDPEFLPAQCIRLEKHRAAPVLELPVELSTQSVPPLGEHPCLYHVDSQVFIKHWNFAQFLNPYFPQNGEQDAYKSVDAQVVGNFIETRPHDDALLTVAVVKRSTDSVTPPQFSTSADAFEFSTTEIQFTGINVPLSICVLAIHGILSLHYVSARSSLQFVFHQVSAVAEVRPTLRLAKSISNFLSWLRNFKGGDLITPTPNFDKDWVFDAVRRTRDDNDTSSWTNYKDRVRSADNLHVKLRNYQERAVAWMLSRELNGATPLFEDRGIVWPETTKLAKRCNLNRKHVEIVETFAFHSPTLDIWFGAMDGERKASVEIGPGGLLCDEMGLGKTVELMQLVVCNQSPKKYKVRIPMATVRQCRECGGQRGNFLHQSCVECDGYYHTACSPAPMKPQKCFLCAKCVRRMAKLCHESTPASALPESRATLVIVPPALLLQWQGELAKHVKQSLKIVTFLGLKRSGYIPQRTLLRADVVLSTYDALKSDVATVQALRNPRANLRSKKQYFPTPVPLLLIRWHRVALDESQMLGASSNTLSLKMARYLNAKYRWCVTGTPIADDLKGSLAMLSVLSSTEGATIPWQKLCAPTVYVEDRNWVASTLRSIMWRTMKVDVDEGELDLPPQIVEVVRTKFGPIERYHYRSLQREVVWFRATQRNRNTRFATYSREILTTLRQACCHPNVGTSGRRLLMSRVSRSQASRRRENTDQMKSRTERPMDMSEVLTSLISKGHAECQDSLRNCIASLNGLAGIRLLQASVEEAPELNVAPVVSAIITYRKGLSLASDLDHLVKMDGIQRMHILFNLAEALDLADGLTARLLSKSSLSDFERNGVQKLGALGRTLREGSLKDDFLKLRKSYLLDAETNLKLVTEDLKSKTSSLESAPLIYDSKEELELSQSVAEEIQESDCGSVSQESPSRSKIWWWERALGTIVEASGRKSAQQLCQIAESVGDDIQAQGWETSTMADTFVNDVRDALESNRKNVNRSVSRLYNRLENFMNFANVVESEIRALAESRRVLIAKLKVLPGGRPPTDAEVIESGQCSGCRESMRGPPCSHCLAEDLVQDVENRLYSVSDLTMYPEDSVLFDATPSFSSRVTRAAAVRSAMVGSLRPSSRVRHGSGARMAGELEIVLRKVSGAALKLNRSLGLKQDIVKWFEQLQKLKDEFASAKVVLEAQRALLASMDEVKMAQTRLTLFRGSSVSDLSETERRYHVAVNEVGMLARQFEEEHIVALKDVEDKKGRLSYLLSLKKSMEGSAGKRGRDEFEETCAICYTSFTEAGRLGVFACAHLFCGHCTMTLIKRRGLRQSTNPSAKIACPTCRRESRVSEVSFTNIGPKKCSKKPRCDVEIDKRGSGSSHGTEIECGQSNTLEENRDNINNSGGNVAPSESGASTGSNPGSSSQNWRTVQDRHREELSSTFVDRDCHVNGSNGCKIAMLIRLLSGIWKKDCAAKAIVFSEWEEALDLVRNALDANHMQHFDGGSFARSSNTFSQTVEAFKRHPAGVCLLLPLKKAGAGLNLIEATHVILVEPSMDIRLEKQAIGRVHRIGQTRVTYVHHLIVEGTIEELILKRGDRWRQCGAGAPHDTTEIFDDSFHGPEQLVNEAICDEMSESPFAADVESSVQAIDRAVDADVCDDGTAASTGGDAIIVS